LENIITYTGNLTVNGDQTKDYMSSTVKYTLHFFAINNHCYKHPHK